MRRLLFSLLVVGCGPKTPEEPRSWADFECRDRKASYFVVGSMTGNEAGVELSCAKAGPTIERYTVDREGTKVEDSQAISPGVFNDTWQRIDGAGWRHLDDCPGEKGKDIPVYTFDIADDSNSKTFECDALSPPFPYDGIVQELDQLAATIPGDRGRNEVE